MPATEKEVNSMLYLINNFTRYNLWANATLVHWLKTKSPELLDKEVTSSFPTIRLTLLHILKTQGYWLSVISGEEYSENQGADPESVLSEVIDQSARIVEFVESMPAESIQDETMVINPWFECNFPNFEYILHLVNHTTYHRGQIITVGRQLGLTDAPITDYNFFNVRGK
ncbi:hypothetical protein DYBT9275_01858 [Dyadobacter sp. CECT 9275]|uniref:Damage-inducible protein DinB n=2 Tax=Dyadobacter helix TaxID=2822344 RepID=A0A916JBF2_9BACT|nr:hypothetical protein DYBT9275_01858 [Dyadobacter sp. CECT 9275]